VIQTIVFLAGVNTLLQVHFGTRLPAVMAGSYAYIYAIAAIAVSPRYLIIIDPLEVSAAPPYHPPSVFLQSVTDLTLILIDDGSTPSVSPFRGSCSR